MVRKSLEYSWGLLTNSAMVGGPHIEYLYLMKYYIYIYISNDSYYRILLDDISFNLLKASPRHSVSRVASPSGFQASIVTRDRAARGAGEARLSGGNEGSEEERWHRNHGKIHGKTIGK